MIKGTPGVKTDHQTARKARATMAAIRSWYLDPEIPWAELGAGVVGLEGAGAGDADSSNTVMTSFCP